MDDVVADGAVDTSLTDSGSAIETETPSINPAWNDLLGVIPDAMHPLVTPHLRKWDDNFNKVQSTYAPYSELINSGTPYETVQNALNVMSVLDSNPRAVYDKMVETFGEEWGLNTNPAPVVGAPSQDSAIGEELDFGAYPGLENDPKFKELMQNQNTIASYLYNQQLEVDNAAADSALDAEIQGLVSKYGQFDEQYVLSLAAGGMSLENAVIRYNSMVEGIRSTPRPGQSVPQIMPTAGSVPSNAIDVTDLNSQQTRQLALSYLKTQG